MLQIQPYHYNIKLFPLWCCLRMNNTLYIKEPCWWKSFCFIRSPSTSDTIRYFYLLYRNSSIFHFLHCLLLNTKPVSKIVRHLCRPTLKHLMYLSLTATSSGHVTQTCLWNSATTRGRCGDAGCAATVAVFVSRGVKRAFFEAGGAGLALSVAGKVCQSECVQVSAPVELEVQKLGIPGLRSHAPVSAGVQGARFLLIRSR